MSKIDLYPNLKSPPSQARVATGTDFVGDKHALDVNVLGGTSTVTGELSISGLRIGGRNTTMNVTDTATKLPAVPFPDRNSMSVTNLSGVDIVYVGFSAAVTADRVIGITSGAELGPNEGMNFDLTDAVEIWGITEAGKTVMIKIMEIA